MKIARGEAATAEACWRSAIVVAKAQGAASWELRAATRLARRLADRGERDEATSGLSAAVALIDGGRIAGLDRVLAHMQKKGGAWIARRDTIARHWREGHGR